MHIEQTLNDVLFKGDALGDTLFYQIVKQLGNKAANGDPKAAELIRKFMEMVHVQKKDPNAGKPAATFVMQLGPGQEPPKLIQAKSENG